MSNKRCIVNVSLFSIWMSINEENCPNEGRNIVMANNENNIYTCTYVFRIKTHSAFPLSSSLIDEANCLNFTLLLSSKFKT